MEKILWTTILTFKSNIPIQNGGKKKRSEQISIFKNKNRDSENESRYVFFICFFSHFPFVQTQPKVLNPSKQGSKTQKAFILHSKNQTERESNGVVIIVGGGADADGEVERQRVHSPSLRRRLGGRVEAPNLPTHQCSPQAPEASLPQTRLQTGR